MHLWSSPVLLFRSWDHMQYTWYLLAELGVSCLCVTGKLSPVAAFTRGIIQVFCIRVSPTDCPPSPPRCQTPAGAEGPLPWVLKWFGTDPGSGAGRQVVLKVSCCAWTSTVDITWDPARNANESETGAGTQPSGPFGLWWWWCFFGHAAACRILVPGPGIKGTYAPCSERVESHH